MGTIQKRLSVRFGFITLLVAICSVLFGLYSAEQTSAAVASYQRVSNQTIKFFAAPETSNPNEAIPEPVFYHANIPQGSTGSAVNADTHYFWNLKETDNNPQICERLIRLDNATTDQWRQLTKLRSNGSCAAEYTDAPISINNSGAEIFFFATTLGTIQPTDTTASQSEFTKILTPSSLGLSSGENIYRQTRPSTTCPRLLFQYASGGWGFIAPVMRTTTATDAGSKYYLDILRADSAVDITNKGGCWAGDNGEIRINNEKVLGDILGSTESFWKQNYPNNISFHNLKGNIKQLHNAVGTIAAADLKLGNFNPDSVVPSLTDTTASSTNDPPVNSCAIDGIGWLICPVVNFMASIVDSSYGVVSTLLTTPNVNLDTGSDMYKAWAIMRSFANIAFVIAFLIIIFAQLTSVGITNYGVKKMLPRLIIAAILVNVSYFVCAIAVDASNITGSSIKQLLDGVGGQLAGPTFNQGVVQNGNGWTGIVSFVLLGGVVMYAGLSVLLPALIAALVAIVTVFLVLTLRQALLVLLIVVSPLAFVAYLLPNTEILFTKWRKLLTTLLLMYPIIAGIFGASALASTIIMASSTEIPVQTMGALVAVIPLFITPIVMKSAGGLLNRFGGMVNNPNKGPFDRLRKGAEGYRNNRKEFRNLKAITGDGRTMPGISRFAKAKADRTAVLENRKRNLGLATADMIADKSKEDAGFRSQLAKGGGAGADQRAFANAISVQADLQAKEVNAAAVIIEDLNLSSVQVKALATGGTATSKSGQIISGSDSVMRKAAIKQAVSIGTVGDVEEIIKSSGSMDSDQRKLLSSSVASSGITNKATHLAGITLDDIAQGKIKTDADLDMATARAINGGKYSAAKIVQNEPASLERVIRVVTTGVLDKPGGAPANGAVIRSEATKAIREPTLAVQITTGQNPLIDQLIV